MPTGPIALVFGTRPELVKLAPVLAALGSAAVTTVTVHTGQHPEAAMAPIRADLGLDPPTVTASVTPTPRQAQLADARSAIRTALRDLAARVVVVQGDTNSTLAGATAARDLGLPVVHVEAGLRSFDRAMPEERNRLVVDHLSDLLLAPTPTARDHLVAEGIAPERIVVTGNTVVDAARACLPDPATRAAVCGRFGVDPHGFVLATFHRPENVDDPAVLARIVETLAALPGPVLFPVHPRTRDRAAAAGIPIASGTIRPVDPLPYREFLALEAEAAVIVSDSGGVQEEAAVLATPVVVVRRSTERPETVGTVARLVAVGPETATAVREVIARGEPGRAALAELPCPYGDGRAGSASAAAIAAHYPA